MMRFVICFAVLSALSPMCLADGWGHLEGQITLDGAVPSIAPLVKKGDATVKDAAVCAAQDVPNDAMAFDPETKGVANVFVFMRRAPKNIHPDLKTSKEKEVEFDQKGCRFLPHAMIVRTDQTVICKSSDAVAHNVHTNPFTNSPSNFIVQPNDSEGLEVKLPQAERLPVKVVCDIHPWMLAWWVVVDHPYAAVTDAQGKFRIENLPEGEVELAVWHEATGYIERKLTVNIQDGKTEAVEIKAPVGDFKE
ncbi:MAG: hypothetical protein KDA80_04840 [Planctomycetaceae bacterium]|nr:hypothetical protein [Planctomycetaceae bacterium]